MVDINPHASQTADLLNIDGTLTISETSITDFNIGAPGKYQLIHASGEITGYTFNISLPTGETIVTNFIPYIMESPASTKRFGIFYTVENFDHDILANIAIKDGYGENSGKTALNCDPMDYGQVMLRLGVERDIRRWEKLNLQARYQYSIRLNGARFLESNTQFARATTPHAMNIRALDQGRDFMNFGIRGLYYFNKTRTMYTYYGYGVDLYQHGTAHTGTAGFVRQW